MEQDKEGSDLSNRASEIASRVISPSIVQAVGHKGAYNAVLATVLGTSIWHSFINGPVAYKHLPRQQFGNLQSQLFPYYFSIQTGGSALLAWLWSRNSSFGRALDRKLISIMFAGGALNLILVGPWTTSIMRRRHRQERIEGTTYDQTDRPHSDKMKALNKKFALAHSVSALLNLGFVGASVALSLLVGEYGLSA